MHNDEIEKRINEYAEYIRERYGDYKEKKPIGGCTVDDYYSKVNSIEFPIPREEQDVLDQSIKEWMKSSKMFSRIIRCDNDDSESFEEKLDKARMKAAEWLINGDTGISSVCLCGALFDIKPNRIRVPSDCSDFKRCEDFLSLFDDDEVLEYIWDNVSKFSKDWDTMSFSWNDLCKIYEATKDNDTSPALYWTLQNMAK